MTGIPARVLIVLGPTLIIAACGSKTEQIRTGSEGQKVTYLGKEASPKDKTEMVFQ